jgi:hypothetical protein
MTFRPLVLGLISHTKAPTRIWYPDHPANIQSYSRPHLFNLTNLLRKNKIKFFYINWKSSWTRNVESQTFVASAVIQVRYRVSSGRLHGKNIWSYFLNFINLFYNLLNRSNSNFWNIYNFKKIQLPNTKINISGFIIFLFSLHIFEQAPKFTSNCTNELYSFHVTK